MKKKFEAFLREEHSLRELAIADAGKPAIDKALITRWRSLFNIASLEASAAIVMILQVKQDLISILLTSDGSDPANVDASIANGLYCVSAQGKSGLLLTNKATSETDAADTGDMPSVKTCFGLPIQWPDEALFGVVCVLSHAGKTLKPVYWNVLSDLKTALELDLELLISHQQAPQISKQEAPAALDSKAIEKAMQLMQAQQQAQPTETDALTSVYSRKKIEDILKHEFDRAKRYFKTFSVTMIDLKDFREVNNSFGRAAGDEILKAFAKSIGSKIRETDFWGRWGGDAFILVCPYADTVETQQMFTRIKPLVTSDMKAVAAYTDFYFGVSQYEPDDLTHQAIVRRAEENMEQYEEMLKRKAFAEDSQNAGTQ